MVEDWWVEDTYLAWYTVVLGLREGKTCLLIGGGEYKGKKLNSSYSKDAPQGDENPN